VIPIDVVMRDDDDVGIIFEKTKNHKRPLFSKKNERQEAIVYIVVELKTNNERFFNEAGTGKLLRSIF
jgi:hypothetical protein